MHYRLISPKRSIKHSLKQATSPDELLSPEQKHEQKVKGLLDMIDAQFQSMHQYNHSFENYNNYRTEPNELTQSIIANEITAKQTNTTETRYKNALSSMLHLVDTNILKSQKLSSNNMTQQKAHYLTPKNKKKTIKVNQSVEAQNDTQVDCSRQMKTQMSNTSIQDASCQTKPNKKKKLGYFAYQISYLSPKCNHYLNGSDRIYQEEQKILNPQNQRTQSNYVNSFKELSENTKQSEIKQSNNQILIQQNVQKQKQKVSKTLISCLQLLPKQGQDQNQLTQQMENIKILQPKSFQFHISKRGPTQCVYKKPLQKIY